MMELRRISHFHFVNSIKGGCVSKSMNVDSRGYPGLKFKEIKNIYNLKDTVYPGQVPRICLRHESERSPTKCYSVKVDSPDFSLVSGIKIKTEPEASDLSCGKDGDEKTDDLDDLSFGNMSLKQFKKKCKSKKRKLSNLPSKDDESDLEEPLIRLKSKLSKNLKSKRKSLRKSVSATSPNTMSHHVEDLPQPNQESLLLVKVEVLEHGHSECRTISGVTSVSNFSYSEQVDSIVTVSKDVPETTDSHVLETEVPYPTIRPQHCSLNEVSYECRGNLEPKFDVGVSSWDIVMVDTPEVVSYDNSDLHPLEEPLQTVSNALSCEYIEDLIPIFGANSSGWEIVKVDNPEMISYQCSDLQEFGQESYAVYALPYDIPLESMPPTKDCSPHSDGSLKRDSSEIEITWQTNSFDRTGVPEMDHDDRLQCLENINEASARGYPLNCASSPSSDAGLYWSSPCLNPEIHSVPVSGHSPSAGKQSQLHASMEIEVDASDKRLMASPGHPDNHQTEQQYPERLLSSRKAISPPSQERLCRAMELTGLDDDQHQECKGKLYFGKHTNHRILRAQGLDQLGTDGATIKPKPFTRKVKQDKRGSPTKGILKVTHPSRSVPNVSNACTTVQRCTQSAIAFTQRQLQDIESLSIKLTTELKSMKDIVMGKLHSKLEVSAAATTMNENVDEAVRVALESATKAEETARKWLSMMARDCNRFHKIMRLTEDNAAASECVIQKERKIIFADEAGGKLCHIKFFKDDRGTASLQECEIEKQRLQVE